MFYKRPNVWKGVAAGMIGGLVASWVMEEFQSLASKFEQKKPRGSEEEPATVKAADRLSVLIRKRPVSRSDEEVAGELMHYAMGAVSGAVYGGVSELNPAAAAGMGALFGAALWAAADEVAVPALGLSKSPTAYPPQVHAKALASHLVYGVSTELVRRSIRKIT